jgi:hypothetical protein
MLFIFVRFRFKKRANVFAVFLFNPGSAIFVALGAPFVKSSETSLKNPMSKPFEKSA